MRAQQVDLWNEYVVVFVNDKTHAAHYPGRMIAPIADDTNGMIAGRDEILQLKPETEDQSNPLCRFQLKRRRKQHVRAARKAIRA